MKKRIDEESARVSAFNVLTFYQREPLAGDHPARKGYEGDSDS